MNQVIPVREILAVLKRKSLGGAKVPHFISNPVLRWIGDRLVIAVFINTYQKKDLDQMQMPRPTFWMIADIVSGELIDHYDCRKIEFSPQPYDVAYSIQSQASAAVSAEYLKAMYQLFDDIRNQYVNTGGLDAKRYAEYLAQVKNAVPPGYYVFYQDLSNI